MKGIQYLKSVPRYLLVRFLGRHWPGLYTGRFACIALRDLPVPALPGPHWLRVRTRLCGICGSDLATIQATSSPYFSPFISFPFVLGHEVVGEVAEVGPAVQQVAVGDRVTIEPVLCCAVRGIADPCSQCRQEHYGNCENLTQGDLAAGIQTGFCRDTGGGWSPTLVAHVRQVHRIPPGLSNEEAVLIEPFSCALHAVLQAQLGDDATVLVIGCGTIGLLTIAAIRAVGKRCRIVAIAKYSHQEALARELGAEEVIRPGQELYRSICAATGASSYQPELGKPVLVGGCDVTFDCVGSATSLDDALRFTRARGRVMVVGMPAMPSGVDWTALWHKELKVQGAYTYGTETYQGERLRTFQLAIRLLEQSGRRLRRLVSARFPLSDYRRAIADAMHAGRSQSVKTVFEFDPAQAL